eukprot:scaffold87634_cov35-Tisochrysis_lutea.AAC.1
MSVVIDGLRVARRSLQDLFPTNDLAGAHHEKAPPPPTDDQLTTLRNTILPSRIIPFNTSSWKASSLISSPENTEIMPCRRAFALIVSCRATFSHLPPQ